MNSDLLIFCGRTFPDYSAPVAGTTSRQSLPRWTESGIWADGECLMLGTSDWPNDAAEYSAVSLAEILEPSPPPKYWLSAQACAGILRRAERRGKTLPERLEAALRAVVQNPIPTP